MKDLKKDFPILKRQINKKPLVYLDNAATSQVPTDVLKAMTNFEFNHRANIHRGIHSLSEEATEMYEKSRANVADFIKAKTPSEIIFVRNTTEAINLVAFAWGRKNLKKEDIIVTSKIEHHSNLICWQKLCMDVKCKLEFVDITEDGKIDLSKSKIDWKKVKFVALTHASNVLGTIVDIKSEAKAIRKKVGSTSVRFLVDGAQSVPHFSVNVQKLGIDFLAFSGHKMCGPMGIGVLWVKKDVLNEMQEFLTGGGMIEAVSLEKSSFVDSNERFEAGTPNVSGAVGLSAACEYLKNIGMDKIREHEIEITKYALKKLSKTKGIQIYGPLDPNKRTGLVSFNVDGIHAHDMAAVLDTEGVAVRSGQHCAMPWHINSGALSTVRASFYLYNSKEDVDVLIKGIEKAIKILN